MKRLTAAFNAQSWRPEFFGGINGKTHSSANSPFATTMPAA
jgi:hypothetical protein